VKSLAALVVAAGLVVAAVVVRDRLDDGGGGGGGGTTVACPRELARACAALADDHTVRVEEAGTTADRLARSSPDGAGIDVWLVPRPWAELVADRRARDGRGRLTGRPSAVIARTPVAVAAWDDRARALERGACRGTLGWRCLGDAAERPWADMGGDPAWGAVRVGLADPHTATGLAVLGGAVAGFYGRSDYAANDFGGDLDDWLGALAARSTPASAGDPVARLLTRGPAEFAAVGAPETTARQAADHDGTGATYPAPVATADLVAVPVGADGGPADRAADVAGDGDLRRALAAAGWRVEGERAARGVAGDQALPPGDGLPSGAVLGALLDEWDQVTP
jgi:hypothetical protein